MTVAWEKGKMAHPSVRQFVKQSRTKEPESALQNSNSANPTGNEEERGVSAGLEEKRGVSAGLWRIR